MVDPIVRTVRKTPANENLTMKINRRTLALIIVSLCGTGAVSRGQEDGSLLSIAGGVPSQVDQASGMQRLGSYSSPETASGSLSDVETIGPSMSLSDYSTEYSSEPPAIPGMLAAYGPGNSDVVSHTSSSGTCDPCGSGVVCDPSPTCKSSLGWMDFDNLLWWGRGLTNSPVIVGGTAFPPTTPLLGGADHPVGTDLLYGLRADVGLWLDECQNYGVGGRAWGILSNGQEKIITNGGDRTAVQFYDANLFGNTNYLLVNNPSTNPPRVGTIGVLSELGVFSGELYLRSRLIADRGNRTDLLTGYTFLRLDSGYRLTTSSSNGSPAIETLDQFVTTNTFHGGHIGLSNSMTRGRFGFGLTGKVALGNMESTSNASGLQVPVVNPNSGLFVQDSNNDPITRNYFTFIPETNAKMRYRLGQAELGIGYSLVLLPNVAMAPSQIDRYVDGNFNPAVSQSPHPQFNTEAFFLHGLDLGLSFRF
jgi:hypothetical protein